MAGVSAKEIKNRIRSMESTRQITRAMELVAASKLRKAQNQAIATRPYYTCLYETINSIAEDSGNISSPYMSYHTEGKTVCIVIAGDRGLSGGYNNNVLKQIDPEHAILPIGKKAVEYCAARSMDIISEEYLSAEKLEAENCFQIANSLCEGYLAGKYNNVILHFTNFVSVLTQTPATLKLLPLENIGGKKLGRREMLYEPDPETVLSALIPEYLGGVIYGALCESRASEQAARRGAMDAATQNADTMIEDLSLQLNRARQAAITREITEIVAGV